jgi:hypothetical protein
MTQWQGLEVFYVIYSKLHRLEILVEYSIKDLWRVNPHSSHMILFPASPWSSPCMFTIPCYLLSPVLNSSVYMVFTFLLVCNNLPNIVNLKFLIYVNSFSPNCIYPADGLHISHFCCIYSLFGSVSPCSYLTAVFFTTNLTNILIILNIYCYIYLLIRYL